VGTFAMQEEINQNGHGLRVFDAAEGNDPAQPNGPDPVPEPLDQRSGRPRLPRTPRACTAFCRTRQSTSCRPGSGLPTARGSGLWPSGRSLTTHIPIRAVELGNQVFKSDVRLGHGDLPDDKNKSSWRLGCQEAVSHAKINWLWDSS